MIIFISFWQVITKLFLTFVNLKNTQKMNNLFGRKKEMKMLDNYMKSGKSEFIAIYGRRRIGKTFLIREYFKDKFAFSMSGIINGKMSEQMFHFVQALENAGCEKHNNPRNWNTAFAVLQKHLETKYGRRKRCVIFIDELPCLDTPRSGFIRALDHFWNSWASSHKNVKLIICGSATSWIIKNIIDSHGGLHNRITHEIHLHQFSLYEVEQYIKSKKFGYDRISIAQLYMAIGGVPYYLSLLEQGKSLPQNIDSLFFADDAKLRDEFSRLYSSLFKSPDIYIQVIRILANNKTGLTRNEICDKLNLKSGSKISEVLSDLTNCDFLRKFNTKEKRIRKNMAIYQLVDFFTLFHFSFVESKTTDANFWTHNIGKPIINTWLGLAFERLCMAHIPLIKKALGIDSIYTEYYAWRSRESTPGSQIDLAIERADRMIDICEIKYSNAPYLMTNEEEMKLRIRANDFVNETKNNLGIEFVLITTYGLRPGKHSSLINKQVTLNDIYKE